jgi:hypothetical protein
MVLLQPLEDGVSTSGAVTPSHEENGRPERD